MTDFSRLFLHGDVLVCMCVCEYLSGALQSSAVSVRAAGAGRGRASERASERSARRPGRAGRQLQVFRRCLCQMKAWQPAPVPLHLGVSSSPIVCLVLFSRRHGASPQSHI